MWECSASSNKRVVIRRGLKMEMVCRMGRQDKDQISEVVVGISVKHEAYKSEVP